MSSASRRLSIAAVAIVVGACAAPPKETVVLLPEAGGKDSAIVVTQGGKELLLDQPYAGAKIASSGGPQKYSANAAEVQAQFGASLAAQPARPAQFTLYFVEGKDEFSDESRKAIDSVFSEIAGRPVPDVLVIGHTDKVGSDASNDVLSRQRAEVVRKALIARGIAPENVVVIGRGKREPIVPTADGAAEPRNRRVEILVR